LKRDILNSKTLWREFYSTLELNPTVIDQADDGGFKVEHIRFKGRALHGERVSVYAAYMHAAEEGKTRAPALLLLGDTDSGVDTELMKMLCSFGYSVLMPDYSGEKQFIADYTVYPEALYYANYERAKNSLYEAKDGARKTCWFEWCCTARFAYEYLKTRSAGVKIGAVGVKGGGEVLLKILPACGSIACAVTINAFGWLAYRGVSKFVSDGEVFSKLSVNPSWMNYLFALDSQSYAPDISAPVLFICTNHAADIDIDRAYDTLARLKSKDDSALLYGVHHRGYVGKSGVNDLKMFLTKYLYDREIYVPEVSRLEIKVDEDGDLVCVVKFDELGEVEIYGVLCGEDTQSAAEREWALMPHKRTLPDGSEAYYLNVTDAASTIYVFVFEKYTNGFTSSSKIVSFDLKGVKFKNKVYKEKVLYSSVGSHEGFYLCARDENTVGGHFIRSFDDAVLIEEEGSSGVKGLLCDRGIITFRVGMTRYAPSSDSILSFDLYAKNSCKVRLVMCAYVDGKKREYAAQFSVSGGERWKKYLAKAGDFWMERESLPSFSNLVSLSFYAEDGSHALINNVVWI